LEGLEDAVSIDNAVDSKWESLAAFIFDK
jgi:hypothetical protein